jgi:hypothetical protein
MNYRPDPRDPITQRFRRSILETVADPYAYSEGKREPEFVNVAHKPGPFERALDALNGRPWLTLAICSALVALFYWIGGAA